MFLKCKDQDLKYRRKYRGFNFMKILMEISISILMDNSEKIIKIKKIIFVDAKIIENMLYL